MTYEHRDHGGCPTMKPRHSDSEAARRAAITASRRNGVRLSYYCCPECRGYHLTRSVGGDNPEDLSMPHHRCHAHDCLRLVPPRLLMCPRHWAMVSGPLQREIWRTYVHGQEVRKDPTAEYLVAHHRAVAHVARKEGHVVAAVEHEALAAGHAARVVITKERETDDGTE